MNFDFSIFKKATKALESELADLNKQIADANMAIAMNSAQTACRADLRDDFDAWLETCQSQINALAQKNLSPRQHTLRKNGPLFVVLDDRGELRPVALLALLGATVPDELRKVVHRAVQSIDYPNESSMTFEERQRVIAKANTSLGTLHAKRLKLLDDAAAAGVNLED